MIYILRSHIKSSPFCSPIHASNHPHPSASHMPPSPYILSLTGIFRETGGNGAYSYTASTHGGRWKGVQNAHTSQQTYTHTHTHLREWGGRSRRVYSRLARRRRLSYVPFCTRFSKSPPSFSRRRDSAARERDFYFPSSKYASAFCVGVYTYISCTQYI